MIFLNKYRGRISPIAGVLLGIHCLLGSAPVDEWKPEEMTRYERADFHFYYPKAWSIASHQDDFDADRRITIDSKDQSHIVIEIIPDGSKMEPERVMAGLLQAYDGPALTVLGRSDFDEWGDVKGSGVHLKGHILGMEPGGVRLFVATVEKRGMVITEYYFSDELADAMPGFDLIMQSLAFH